MSQLVIPNGFELINFAWDHLPASLRGVGRVMTLQPAAFATARVAPASMPIEHASFEEDAERWDGLS